MKKLILVALLVVGITTFAQEKSEERKEKFTPEQRVDFQVKKMTKDLSLDTKQAEQVKNLLTQESQKREAKRAQFQAIRTNGQKPTEEQRKEMRAKMEAEKTVMNDEMKKILTADQYSKWQQKQEERKEKMAERMKEKQSDKL
jgi:periplasmic protein CpxP/Spy